MSFSVPQQARYRPLVRNAWMVEALRSGTNDRDLVAYRSWYQGNVTAALGVPTTKGANQTEDFDVCMLQFAMIAGDEYWINRASAGAERRMRFVIRQKLRDLGALEARDLDWSYARAVYQHMNLPESMSDCPARLLWKVCQAIDTHIRRIRASRGDLIPNKHGLGDGRRRRDQKESHAA